MTVPMTRLRRRLVLSFAGSMLAVFTTACSGPAPGIEADANSPGPDSGFIGGQIGSGIGLLFVSVPPFGETFSHDDNTISVSSAEFTIVDLRLIGDAASGDFRTSKDLVELSWKEGEAEPVPVGYEDAPPGMYSRVRGTVIGFSIDGDVELSGGSEAEFEVEQESVSLPIEFSLALSLEAGEGQTLTVEVDLKNITEEIPFKDLTIENGEIEVDEGSEAMEKVEEKIGESFEVAD